MEKERWRKTRTIAFSALIGSHLDPKKLPKSEEHFLPLEKGAKKAVNKEIIQEMRREREEALRKIKEKK